MFQDFVKEGIKAKFNDNINNFDKKNCIKKVISFCEKHGLDKEYQDFYINEISQKNKFIIALFEKEPLKQNLPEKLFFEYVNNKDVVQLPQGSNSIKFGNSKAADFVYNEIYFTLKYTTTAGGSQDNQKNDVILFLNEGIKSNMKVGAVVDGDYWNERILELKKIFPNIFTVDEFKDFISGRT